MMKHPRGRTVVGFRQAHARAASPHRPAHDRADHWSADTATSVVLAPQFRGAFECWQRNPLENRPDSSPAGFVAAGQYKSTASRVLL